MNGEAKAITDLQKGWIASVAPKTTDFTTAAKIDATKAATSADAPVKTQE